ncbi:MAG: type II toxin-antitoxin system RelE/ParE family toxin [Fibromonadales bacterium]|nr:type II toxin-antitoxin system RelE/ParE family toxin [Fibromonadales bacterium]
MGNDSLKRKASSLTPRCKEQLNKAMTFIAADSPRQAEIMAEQFSAVRKIMEIMPEIGSKYKNGIRKFLLGKFPYYIYYKEKETEIEILGIWHTSRGTEFEA